MPCTVEGARSRATRLALTTEVRSKDRTWTRVLVVAGAKGWVKLDGRRQELTRGQLEEEKERMYASWVATLAPLADKGFTLSPAGTTTVAGREAAGVLVRSKGHRPVKLFFDKEKGLLVKKETTIKDPLAGGRAIREEVLFDLDGYRPTKVKVLHARKVKVFWDGKLVSEVELTEVEPKEKLPARTFARP
jgi:hypothetical protein